MLVSLITSLFTLYPLWQSQASASPPVSWWVSSDGELSWGHLTRLTLGEAGETCLRITLWALGLGTELISDSDGNGDVWERRCVYP